MRGKLTYSLVVCAGGAVYGLIIPLVRGAYAAGFTTMQVLITQYLCATAITGVAALVVHAWRLRQSALGLRQLDTRPNGTTRARLGPRSALQLALLGMLPALTSLGFYQALGRLPSSTAITLLFQFVWIGVIIAAVAARRLPNRTTLLAVAVVVVGTLLATGVFESGLGTLDAYGVACGFWSALSYAVFLFVSGRFKTEHSLYNRLFCTCAGSLVLVSCVSPAYYLEAQFLDGIAAWGVPLAVACIIVPVFLIQWGAPYLPPSLTTIMASSELPSGIACAALFMGDALSPLIVLGVVVILGGIVLAQYPHLKRLRG